MTDYIDRAALLDVLKAKCRERCPDGYDPAKCRDRCDAADEIAIIESLPASAPAAETEGGMVLYCNEKGQWEVYDDTYDITIHCKSQSDQDKALERLRSLEAGPVPASLHDMAVALQNRCKSFLEEPDGLCADCEFGKEYGTCKIYRPLYWGI